MKDQEKIHFEPSLEDMNESIHWSSERQQHSRKIFLIKLQRESVLKHKSWVKRGVLPVLATILFSGIIITLFLSETNVTMQQNEPVIESNHADQGFEVIIDEEVKAAITEINQSAFDLRLPKGIPIENTELKNVWLRETGSAPLVTASYFDREGNELFTFMQEDLSGLDAKTAGDAINRMEENADYETEINGNTTFISENDQSGLITVNIITNDYGFTLSTYVLTEEQLLTVSKSIDT